jgi:hypothetical protein
MFGGIDEEGSAVQPLPPLTQTGIMAELAMAGRHGRGGPTYQVQVFAQSYTPLSAGDFDAAHGLYTAARQSLRRQLLAQIPDRNTSH